MSLINPKYFSLDTFVDQFRSAQPFPHIVLDDFLEEDVFVQICRSRIQTKIEKGGKYFHSKVEKKKWISLNCNLRKPVADVLHELNSVSWINNLTRLSHIELITTKTDNKMLANYHEMEPGGYLGPHVDHSSDPISGMPHVLNIILFLSDKWNSTYGGSTRFHDKRGKKIMAEVEFKPNRALIFLHTPYSFHSVKSISEDASSNRCSLYVDYYSKTYKPYDHLTLPFSKTWFTHGTTFKFLSPFDVFSLNSNVYRKANFVYFAKRILSRLR